MARTARLAVAPLLCGLMLAGCDRVPTDPAPPAAADRHFPEAPNVFWGAIGLVATIFDPQAGLLAAFGLPPDPLDWRICGGDLWEEPVDGVFIGWKREDGVIHFNGRDQTVNVRVYATSTDDLLALACTATPPIAEGTGRLKINDNDMFGSGGGNNAVSVSVTGTLTDLRTGQPVQLDAYLHVVQDLGTVPWTIKMLKQSVSLSPTR